MSKWILVLALPYVVTISTHEPCPPPADLWTVHTFDCGTTDYAIVPIGFEWKDKEVADDMAEALNEAHERRLYPNGRVDAAPPNTTIILDMPRHQEISK